MMNRDSIVETRGGCHVLINSKNCTLLNPMWYKKLKDFSDPECTKEDFMMPIPGTYQGGHLVTITHYYTING